MEEPSRGCAPSPATPCALVSGPKRARAFWAPKCHFRPLRSQQCSGSSRAGMERAPVPREALARAPFSPTPPLALPAGSGSCCCWPGVRKGPGPGLLSGTCIPTWPCPLVDFDQQLLGSRESQRGLWEGTMVSRAQHCPCRDTWQHCASSALACCQQLHRLRTWGHVAWVLPAQLVFWTRGTPGRACGPEEA